MFDHCPTPLIRPLSDACVPLTQLLVPSSVEFARPRVPLVIRPTRLPVLLV